MRRIFGYLSPLLLLLLFSLLQQALAASSRVMPPQYAVRAVTGVSYRCEHSTAAPALWLTVEWEETDAAGNHSVTIEPHVEMEELPLVVTYLSWKSVEKDVRRQRAAATRKHVINVDDANRIATFVVRPFLANPPTHHAHGSLFFPHPCFTSNPVLQSPTTRIQRSIAKHAEDITQLLRKNGKATSKQHDPELPADVYEVLLDDGETAYWPTNRANELPSRLMNPVLADPVQIKQLLRKNAAMGTTKYLPDMPASHFEVLLSTDEISYWPTKRAKELDKRLLSAFAAQGLSSKNTASNPRQQPRPDHRPT